MKKILVYIVFIFFCKITIAQTPFCGRIEYSKCNLNSNDTILSATLFFSKSKILRENGPSNDDITGFTKHLFIVENGKAFYYMINPTLQVALKKEIDNEGSEKYKIIGDSSTYNIIKIEGNPTKTAEPDLYFEATHKTNSTIKILNENNPIKCYPMFGFLFGNLIENSISTFSVRDNKNTVHTFISKKEESILDDSIFLIDKNIKIEEYSSMRFSELVFEYKQIKGI